MLWPWTETPRVPAPNLVGDVEGARAHSLWAGDITLEQMMALLCTGVPGDGEVDVHLQLVGDDLHVEICGDTCHIEKRFVIQPDGVDVVFDRYFLPEELQNTGHAKHMFKNLLVGYRELDVSFIVTLANHKVGGYTWARLAARPKSADEQRDVLLDRLEPVAKQAKFTTREARALEKLIERAPIERLMYEVARSVSPEGKQLGKPLLIGHHWEAFWDLSDPDHRVLIAEALA